MSDNDLTRIDIAIRNKKSSINHDRYTIDCIIEDIFSTKIQILKTNTAHKNSKLESNIKIGHANIKKVEKKMRISIKKLRIYEAEYEKSRKDPNYNIDFISIINKTQ